MDESREIPMVGERVREAAVAVVEGRKGAQIPRSEGAQEDVVGRLQVRHYKNVRSTNRGGCGGLGERKSVPSDLPPCPTAASKLCGLAVEPILDILSDRL